MEFTPQASWGAKSQWHNREKLREKYICPRHLRRTLNKGTVNYENIHPSYRSGYHAWLEFVRRGAGRDHDHHDAREYHGSAAGGDAADNDYSDLRLLVATLRFTGSARRMVARSSLFS
jgi:hypothetical protein